MNVQDPAAYLRRDHVTASRDEELDETGMYHKAQNCITSIRIHLQVIAQRDARIRSQLAQLQRECPEQHVAIEEVKAALLQHIYAAVRPVTILLEQLEAE